MKVFEVLVYLKQNGPEDILYGICGNIEGCDYTVWEDHYIECFHSWEEFSGVNDYPVPSMDDDVTPSHAFFNTMEGMWSGDNPYGAARLRLLDHCINWYKERNL